MRPHSQSLPIRHRGFTIMELMFTVSIAAILMAVAVPSFRTMIANNRLVTMSNELVSAVSFSRSEAIRGNVPVTLCRAATAASTNCVTSTGAWRFWIVRNSAGTVLRRGELPDYGGLMSFSSDLTLDAVAFGADGVARTGGVVVNDNTFTICSTQVSENNARTITLGAGSRVSTEKSTETC